jgi:biopolymer transport protein ExbB
VASVLQPRGSEQAAEGGGGGGYIGILVKNLTVDAWAVIILCGVMLVVAVWVMVAKAMLIGRTDRGNRAFLDGFRGARDVLDADGPQAHPGSSIARLYEAGRRELGKRDIAKGRDAVISGASLDAVKAAVDADLVRENHRLNNWMVLLTIAISGGPFLGLLGTVVGVMITFAAIAAAGDVNVNAIAPGIAAALLATVAGLGVAIPALFGYNYLASRIKNISADMQIFVDEFVTRVAERYGAAVRRHQHHADAGPGVRAAGDLHHPHHRVGAGRARELAADRGRQQPGQAADACHHHHRRRPAVPRRVPGHAG